VLAVLADDLTGAFDVAEHVIDLFPSIRVHADASAFGDGSPAAGAELVVVSTGTRHLRPASAADVARAALGRLSAAGASLLFAKFDSTLRGNVKAELAAPRGPRGALFSRQPGWADRRAGRTSSRRSGRGAVYAHEPVPVPADRPASQTPGQADLDGLAAEASGALTLVGFPRRRPRLPRRTGRRRPFGARPAGKTSTWAAEPRRGTAGTLSPAAAASPRCAAAVASGGLVVSTRDLPDYRGLEPHGPALLSARRALASRPSSSRGAGWRNFRLAASAPSGSRRSRPSVSPVRRRPRGHPHPEAGRVPLLRFGYNHHEGRIDMDMRTGIIGGSGLTRIDRLR
jgi:hypothetical protein